MGKAKDKLILLPLKEQTFADAILAGMTDVEAGRKAGMSEAGLRMAAWRMKNSRRVAAYIKQELDHRATKRRQETDVDDIWVTQQLKEVYSRCMQGERKMRYDRDLGELVPVTDEAGRDVWEFDSTGAIAALVNIGKHIGYYEADNRQKQTVIKVNIQRNTQINNRITLQEGVPQDGNAQD